MMRGKGQSGRVAVVFALVLVTSCGSGAPSRSEPTAARQESPADPTPREQVACAALAAADCQAEAPRCVWEGACRDPVDECEVVTPEPMWSGYPVFGDGDPCERVRAGCAWNPARRRCSPFAPLTACPATLREAEAATVLCNHSGQPPLECRYGDTRCVCFAPAYCGGAAPPPHMAPSPMTFVCIPPVDAQGCPTGEIRNRSRCRVSPSVTCATCSTHAQCVGGRWRVRELPPRP